MILKSSSCTILNESKVGNSNLKATNFYDGLSSFSLTQEAIWCACITTTASMFIGWALTGPDKPQGMAYGIFIGAPVGCATGVSFFSKNSIELVPSMGAYVFPLIPSALLFTLSYTFLNSKPYYETAGIYGLLILSSLIVSPVLSVLGYYTLSDYSEKNNPVTIQLFPNSCVISLKY
ncbi:MAG: hypothetical protein HZC28_01905 [Spirochaetes bacterium]|nr:hypothetical protein [Spirochaetota bacterium]